MFDDKSQDLTKVAKPAKITFLVSFPVPYGVEHRAPNELRPFILQLIRPVYTNWSTDS